MGDKFRPHGHLGAESTKLAAQRAVMREYFGPYYMFIQRLGGMPVAYFIIGMVIGRPDGWGSAFLYAFVGAVYAFLYHIYAISYLAARSKIGLDKCPKGTVGYLWSRLFIPRAVIMHVVMLGLLIYSEKVGIVNFLLSGVVLYFIDYVITLAATLKYSAESIDNKTGGLSNDNK